MTTILITGANRGIGLEFVRQYAADGAIIHACIRDPHKADVLNELAAQFKNVTVHKLEVTDAQQVAALATALKDAAIDVLINNAGIYGGDHQSFLDIDYDAWEETLAINTMAPLRMIQAFYPHLKKAARPAKIITISSMMGSLARNAAGNYIYRSSKTAVNKIMQLVALDVAKDGIIACPVHPGWVRTDMGGAGADIDVSESVSGLRKLIAGLKQEDSGKFWQWNGQPHEW